MSDGLLPLEPRLPWEREGISKMRIMTLRDIAHHRPGDEGIPRNTCLLAWRHVENKGDQRTWYTEHNGSIVKLDTGGELFDDPARSGWCELTFLLARAPTAFERHDKLGSGNFGTVMRTSHPATPGVEYAMKVIPIASADPGILQREIGAANTLDNDIHIVEYITVVKNRDNTTIIMLPIANRGDLKKALQKLRENPLDSGDFGEGRLQIFRWIYCLAKMLARVHSNDIVHGDIKAENILIHNNTIFYTDFGMASSRSNKTTPGYTSTGATEEWAPVPPTTTSSLVGENINQITGIGTPKGDVFSLGWVIYEMLLVATPSALLDTHTPLPSRLSAKKLAWDNMGLLLKYVDEVNEIAQDQPQMLGPDHGRYAGLTKELLLVVVRHMIVLKAVDRSDSNNVALRIRGIMDRWTLTPDVCCNGLWKPTNKPW